MGVNDYISSGGQITNILRVKPEVERKQRESLVQLRKERDNSKVQQALKRLEDTARGTDNTMPAFLECVEAYATLGEMCDVLRGVFGTQKEFLAF